jgi:hypothetical protein
MKFFIVEKIHTDDNVSDVMTKPFLKKKLEFCKKANELSRAP